MRPHRGLGAIGANRREPWLDRRGRVWYKSPRMRGMERLWQAFRSLKIWRIARDFLWGLAFLETYKEILKEKRKVEDLMNVVILGEFLGLPLMNSTIALRMLPYLFPRLQGWRRHMLTERDITDDLPEMH